MNKAIIKQRYKIEKMIGQGGIGNVYLALDTQTNQHVAIKQSLDTSDKMIARFRREYKFLKLLDHPNIVKGYEFIEEKSNYFLVMEHVNGVTLKNMLKENRENPLSLKKRLEVAIQICRAVDALNINEIYHRDIKPDNIMITDKYIVKILDLGIAKSTNKEMSALTKTGSLIGTPEYASPEQITGKAANNSDVFSIAVVFYQLFLWLENSPFFTGNLAQSLNRVVNKNLSPLISNISNINNTPYEQVYKRLSDIIDKALDKSTEKRTPSARALGEQLLPIYQHVRKLKDQPPEKFSLSTLEYRATQDYVLSDLEEEELVEETADQNIPTKKTEQAKTIKILLMCQVVGLFVVTSLLAFSFYLKSKNNEYEEKIKNLQDVVSSLLGERLLVGREVLQKITDEDLLDTNNVEKLVITGNELLNKEMYEEAGFYFEKAIVLYPYYSQAYYSNGLALQMQKKYSESISYYNQAIEIYNQNPYFYAGRGKSYYYLKEGEKAIEDYNTAIHLDKKNVSFFIHRAIIYNTFFMYEKALEDYSSAILLSPENINLYALRGKILYQLQRYSEAKNDFEKYLKTQKNSEIKELLDRINNN